MEGSGGDTTPNFPNEFKKAEGMGNGNLDNYNF